MTAGGLRRALGPDPVTRRRHLVIWRARSQAGVAAAGSDRPPARCGATSSSPNESTATSQSVRLTTAHDLQGPGRARRLEGRDERAEEATATTEPTQLVVHPTGVQGAS